MAAKWRNSKECREWKEEALIEQTTCIVCGSKDDLEVHHIADGSNHPELRYVLDNAAVLCSRHHDFLHLKYKKSYRHKTTKEDFKDYLSLMFEGIRIGKEYNNE